MNVLFTLLFLSIMTTGYTSSNEEFLFSYKGFVPRDYINIEKYLLSEEKAVRFCKIKQGFYTNSLVLDTNNVAIIDSIKLFSTEMYGEKLKIHSSIELNDWCIITKMKSKLHDIEKINSINKFDTLSVKKNFIDFIFNEDIYDSTESSFWRQRLNKLEKTLSHNELTAHFEKVEFKFYNTNFNNNEIEDFVFSYNKQNPIKKGFGIIADDLLTDYVSNAILHHVVKLNNKMYLFGVTFIPYTGARVFRVWEMNNRKLDVIWSDSSFAD